MRINLKKQKMEKEKQIFCQTNKLTYNLQISKSMDFCIFCCSNVDSSSKHCKLCDRCVNGFDHHCDWINNCIGKQNYTKFIILLLSILIYSIYSSIFEFYSLYQVIVVSPLIFQWVFQVQVYFDFSEYLSEKFLLYCLFRWLSWFYLF